MSIGTAGAPPPATPADGYDPLGSRLVTGEAVALDLMPTPWVLRGAGAAIDFVLSMLLYIALLLFVLVPVVSAGAEDALVATIATLFFVLAFVVVPVAVETLTRGRSVGKFAVGARIVRDDGGAIGLRHSIVRALLGLLEIFATFGGTAAIVGFLNERSKRLGDFLAGTYSQRERVAHRPHMLVVLPPQLATWAPTADVARMPQRLSRRIAQFLEQAAGLTPESRRRLAHELATEASVYVSPLPEVDAEVFLAGVASMRRDREFAALEREATTLARLEPALTALPHGFPDRG